MHDVIKHLNLRIVLPAERLQHGVNIYILPFHGLMRQSTVNTAMCLWHYIMSVVYYLQSVEPTVYGEQYKCLSILIIFIDRKYN